MMKLHSAAPSPNHRKVTSVIAHLGLEVEEIPVNLGSGENKTPEFLKMNPNGAIPVLEDEGFYLPESSAIMIYLCGKQPGQTLLPSEPRQHAEVLRWVFWQVAHFGRAIGTIYFEKLVKKLFMNEAPDLAQVAQGEELFHRYAAVLDGHMKDRQWIVGDSVSLADFANGAMLQYHDVAGLPTANYPHMMAWYKRLEGLDAWRKTAPQMPSPA